MFPQYKIGLFLNIHDPSHRRTITGMVTRAQELGNLELLAERGGSVSVSDIHQRKIDGIILDWWKDRYISSGVRQAALRSGLPTVSIVGRGPKHCPIPQIVNDDEAAGAMAAEHLWARGFRTFAAAGPRGMKWATLRLQGFHQGLARHHLKCAVEYQVPYCHKQGLFTWSNAEMQRRLKSLPAQTGLFVACDHLGEWLLRCAQLAEIAVPGSLAVVSFDNYEERCLFTRPMMSSIPANEEQIGVEAVNLIVGLLQGGAPPVAPKLIPPLPLVVRGSSDIFAIPNAEVAAALKFIHANSHREINIEDILRVVPVSRRALEIQFKKHLGHTLQQEIWHRHIAQAEHFLQTTNWPVYQVARAAGFHSPESMWAVFLRETGRTPSTYRRLARSPGPPTPPSRTAGRAPSFRQSRNCAK